MPGVLCSITCQYTQLPYCGNGVLDAGEECDDGNTRDSDGCTTLCRIERKYCPDGKSCTNDKCSGGMNCVEAFCGDGVVQSALGEECDDGNDINDDDCDNSCKWVPLTDCGDGVVQTNTELCDKGSLNSNNPNAECRINCVPQRCGDGIVDDFLEECDDGNNLNGDDCSAVCTHINPAAPPPVGSVIPPATSVPPTSYYNPGTIPTPAKTPTGPGLVIFLASGAAAGVGLMRRRFRRA